MEHLDDPMLARKEVQKIRRSGTHLPSTSRKSKKMSSLSEHDESKDVKMPAEDSFEVEKVIDKKLEGFEKYYLVLWKGWPESAADWVPYHNMACDDLIAEFEKEERAKRHLKRTRDWEVLPGSVGPPVKVETSKNKTLKASGTDSEKEDETVDPVDFQDELHSSSNDEDDREDTSDPIEEQQAIDDFKEFFAPLLADNSADGTLIQFADVIESPGFGSLMDGPEWESFEKAVDSQHLIKVECEEYYRNLQPLKIIGYFCDPKKNPYVQMEWADGMQIYVSFVASLKHYPKIFLPWLESYLSETAPEEELQKNQPITMKNQMMEDPGKTANEAIQNCEIEIETSEDTEIQKSGLIAPELEEGLPKSLKQSDLKEEVSFVVDSDEPDFTDNLAGKVFNMSLAMESSTSLAGEKKVSNPTAESLKLPSTSLSSVSEPSEDGRMNEKIEAGMKPGKLLASQGPKSRTGRPPKQAKPVVQNRPTTRILPRPQLETNQTFPANLTSHPVSFAQQPIVSSPSLDTAGTVLIGVTGPPTRGTFLYDSKMEELNRYTPMLQAALDKLSKENPQRADPLHRITLLRSVAAHSNVQYDTLSKCLEVIRRSRNWFISEIGPSVIPLFAQAMLQMPRNPDLSARASLPSPSSSSQVTSIRLLSGQVSSQRFPQNPSPLNVSQFTQVFQVPPQYTGHLGLHATRAQGTSDFISGARQMAVRLISSPRTNQREPVGSLGTNQREPVGSLGTNQREPVGSLGTSLAEQIRSRSTNQREPIRSTGTSSTGPAPLHHAYNGSSGQRFVDPRAVGNGLRFSSTSAGLPQQQFRGVSPSNVPSNFDHLMPGPVRFQANDSQAIDGNVTARPQLSVGLSGGSLPSLANPIEQLQTKILGGTQQEFPDLT